MDRRFHCLYNRSADAVSGNLLSQKRRWKSLQFRYPLYSLNPFSARCVGPVFFLFFHDHHRLHRITYERLKFATISGWSNAPPGPSGHILLFTFVVFSMLLHNFYSASIVSSLLSDPPQSIRTIADLLETGMPAAYENASYVPHYFRVGKYILFVWMKILRSLFLLLLNKQIWCFEYWRIFDLSRK